MASPANQKPPPSAFISVLAAAYYISTSVVLTLFNKILFSRFTHLDPPFLLFCQSVISVLVLLFLSTLRKFSIPPITQWSRSSWLSYLPLYVSSTAMLLSGMLALKLTSLLMYNTLRRTSIVFVVIIHSILNRTKPTLFTVAATVLVTLGAFIAGKTDLAFDFFGYSLAFLANISGAIYLVLLKRVRDTLALSNIQLVFVNALSNVPFVGVIMFIWPPTTEILSQFNNLHFVLLFFASCLLSILINHAIFVNTTTNDAVAQSIAAQLKDVALLLLSLTFVDDPSSRAKGNILGVLTGFIGSLVYGGGKLHERIQPNTSTTNATQRGTMHSSERERDTREKKDLASQ